MNIILSFLPALLFLLFLFLLDTFKLVRPRILIISAAWGILSAAGAYFINSWLSGSLNLEFNMLSRYISPVVEEILKAMVIVVLVSKKKIGFLVDAAIYGFAVGAGFSLLENIFYLSNASPDFTLLTGFIRGFGTALMHGGCTALLALLLIAGMHRSLRLATAIWPGLVVAVLLHSAFNHFPVNPLVQTLFILVTLPLVLMITFHFSERKFQQWMELEFSSEVELLKMIRMGQFRSTRAGIYLLSLKDHFTPEMMVDLYCYIGLYLELSIKAKRNLMLQENGFPVQPEKDLNRKLRELGAIRKKIGVLGESTLAPLIRMNYKNLWKLNRLQEDNK